MDLREWRDDTDVLISPEISPKLEISSEQIMIHKLRVSLGKKYHHGIFLNLRFVLTA
jgi:hypothetical protein